MLRKLWITAVLSAIAVATLIAVGFLPFGGLSEQGAEAGAIRDNSQLHGGHVVSARRGNCDIPVAAGFGQPASPCAGHGVWRLTFDMRPCHPGGTATFDVVVDSKTGQTVYESGQMC